MLQSYCLNKSWDPDTDSRARQESIFTTSASSLLEAYNQSEVYQDDTSALFPISALYGNNLNGSFIPYASSLTGSRGSTDQVYISQPQMMNQEWTGYDPTQCLDGSHICDLNTSVTNANSTLSMQELMDWLEVSSLPSLPYYSFDSANTTMLDQSLSPCLSSSSNYHQHNTVYSPFHSEASPSMNPSVGYTPTASDATFSDAAMSPQFFPQQKNEHNEYTITSDITLRGGKDSNVVDVQYPQYSNSTMTTTNSTTAASTPPSTDFDVADPVDTPRKQLEKRRGILDLYTPLWVRGEGMSREGWCRFCTPGSWLNLKTSQYLYHLQNAHGICQITGQVSTPPIQLRTFHNGSQITDGLCGTCHQWITIGTARRRRNFSSWFEHARKCHRKDRPRRVPSTSSSSISSLSPGSSDLAAFASRVPLQAIPLNQHHRAQSCGVHRVSCSGAVLSHKRGAESVSLPIDIKKPRQA